MKPFLHSRIHAKKYGGKPSDYEAIDNWMDATKVALPDMRHRLVLHNAFGIFLCEQQFGKTFLNSDGKEVSVRDVAEDHVLQDLGTIPTLEQCLKTIDLKEIPWITGTLKTIKRWKYD